MELFGIGFTNRVLGNKSDVYDEKNTNSVLELVLKPAVGNLKL